MRVALDLTPCRSGATGVARYASALHDAFAARDDLTLRTFAVGRGGDVGRPLTRDVRWPLRLVHATRWPSVEQLVGPVDVVHSPDLVPLPAKAPVVLTVQDVLPLTRPDWFPPRAVRLAQAQAHAARTVASVVVTTCEATADAVAEVARVPRERIVVTTLGHRDVPAVPPAPVVEPPYLLFVGSVTARKGLATLAAALPDDAPPLVVAGPDGHDADEVRASLAGRDVRLLGRVDDDTLVALYAHATVLCHPSEGEGFGIPVLEAMANGVPVVAAGIPQVREVAGGAAVLAPPGDVEALREALAKVLADESLRDRLADEGRAGAAGRTWEACAAATVEAYRRAIDG